MDPKLLERFAKQKEKEQLGDDLPVAEIGSAADRRASFDPKLQERWAKQREKEETGHAEVEEVGSAADKTTKVDPVLAERWRRLEAEGGAPVREIGSAAVVNRNLDPRLAKAFAKHDEGGSELPMKEIGSAARVTRSLDPALAKAFDKAKLQEAIADGRLEPEGKAVADRMHLTLKAGATATHTFPWKEGARRFAWAAVVMDELTLDVEISAKLKPDPEGKGPSEIFLQRNARGENFVSDFCPTKKRGLADPAACAAAAALAAAKAEEEGIGGHNGHDSKHDDSMSGAVPGQVVEAIVFKFSNAFSWFRGKEVEFVTVFEW